MSLKRVTTALAVGGVLAAMIVGAATSGRRRVVLAPPVQPTAVDVSGAELAAEIARLRERLRPTTPPLEPSRNLFRYSAVPALTPGDAAALPAPGPAEPLPDPVNVAPPLVLIGVAEDAGPASPDGDGAPVRTAILSVLGNLVLAREGEPVTSRYRVARISSEAVELTDVESGQPLRLALK